MHRKKKRDKDRRRARKLADQAWEAADAGDHCLALKIIRRAIELAPGNPALRCDEGLLLEQAGDDDQAAQAFQDAISLAADFAAAYARLAGIRVRQGRVAEAVAAQQEAVRHAPQSSQYRQSLTAYQALAGKAASDVPAGSAEAPATCAEPPVLSAEALDTSIEPARASSPPCCPIESSLRAAFPDLAARVDGFDWTALEQRLTRHGYALLPRLLASQRCAELRGLVDRPELFAKTVVMNKSRFGQGVYRYFRAPLPPLIDAIRRIVYPPAAAIANAWQRLLHAEDEYPPAWEAFRARCAEAGQTTPTPLLLSYEAGGFNAPHCDLRGDVFFPLQLVIVLSPRLEPGSEAAEGFVGGEFLFCDVPDRKPSDRRLVPAGLGDAVLFCTRARLTRVAGVYGLRPVRHGMNAVSRGERCALGVPFHEYE